MTGKTRSVTDLIADVSCKRPHVVVLGAGASRAAFPNGEKYGKRLPLMADFVDIVPVKEILDESGIAYVGRNFEDVFSDLASDVTKSALRYDLEVAVDNYFSSLELTDSPTIYDYLIMSLRPKDIIITFNWDPFLLQAVRRGLKGKVVPKTFFLHGNVLSGYCRKDNIHGIRMAICSQCKEFFERVPLLYPIREKDYDSDPAVKDSWKVAKWAFENAFWVTIFGYGAPETDARAVKLLQDAWSQSGRGNREFEEIEIIDIKNEDSLRESWKDFIFEYHYRVAQHFWDSSIAHFPRRTGEAWRSQFLDADWIEGNPVPKFNTIEELRQWYKPLLDAENAITQS